MPTLEDQLRRYGTLLDDVAHRTDEPVSLTTGGRTRRPARTALLAVAVVAVVTLVAIATSTRSTHEPTPATTPVVGPTTTMGAAESAARRAVAKAWIEAHNGRVVDLRSVIDIAMSDRAVYVWSDDDAGDRWTTLSRVDRKTLHVTSVEVPAAAERLSVAGGALYLFTTGGQPSGWVLERLDPDTLVPRWTTPFVVPSTTRDPEVVGGSDAVWISVGHDIKQLDARSGRVLRSVNLTLADSPASAFLAVDPTGEILYVAYGADDGTTQPLQRRDAHTGQLATDPTINETAAGGFVAPQIEATGAGAWVMVQTPESRGESVASLFRASDLKRIASTEGTAIAGNLAFGGHTLWTANANLVACSDARTGQLIQYWGPLGSDPSVKIYADAIAADATRVAVSIDGTLGIFDADNLCRPEK